MSKILENSIWPNHNGELGEIKVQIPDGITTTWPEGDALVGNFVYNEGNLVGFIDTKALTENEAKSTVLPYDYVNITLDARLESLLQINRAENNKYLTINYEVQLPTGYKRLEYLEATGEQYINTGVPLSSEIDVLVDFSPVFNGKSHVLYGTRRDDLGTNRGAYAQIMPTAGQIVVWRNARRMLLQGVTQTRHALELTGTSLVLDGTVKSTYIEEPWEYTQPCYLGAAINHAEVVSLPLVGRLYAFTLKQGGSKKLNLIPALDTTGTPCMYDIISQEPFYNSGTGQFLYPGAESQVVTSDLDENFYAKMTEHGIRKLYHVPEDYIGTKYEYAIENGFKQLVEPPMPVEGHWTPEWTETDTQLICNWVETEEPKIETL